MQLRFQTDLTGEEYVSREAWQDATLERCPLHPLKPNGRLALNFVGFTRSTEKSAAGSVYRTLGEVLPHKIALVSAPGEDFNDFIFVASNKPIPLNLENRKTQHARWLKRHIQPMTSSKLVIRDDYNPLEFLQLRKAEKYREVLIDRIGEQILIR